MRVGFIRKDSWVATRWLLRRGKQPRLRKAALLQEVTVRLADLDQVPLRIVQVATQLNAVVDWRVKNRAPLALQSS